MPPLDGATEGRGATGDARLLAAALLWLDSDLHRARPVPPLPASARLAAVVGPLSARLAMSSRFCAARLAATWAWMKSSTVGVPARE